MINLSIREKVVTLPLEIAFFAHTRENILFLNE